MSEVAIAEVLAEPVPPILPAPEAAAEVETAPPQALEAASAEAPAGEVETEVVESFDPRIAIPESLGAVRRAILEGLIDADEPLSVSQLHALMPVGTARGTAEAGILREFRSGRIMRTSPGHYALAPARPPEAKPLSPPPPSTPEDEATWLSALEAWAVDPASWSAELGPPLDQADNRIPPDVRLRFTDRVRKRALRRKEADEAAAKRAAADRELLDQLIAATGGNIIRSSAIDDVAPIKMAMELVPVDRILSAIRCKTDRKMYPKNEPATSWREERLLREVAQSYCNAIVIPSLVEAWSKATAKTQAPNLPPVGQMLDDIDELRRRHDHEHAPPGPHSLPKPPTDEDADAASSADPGVAGAARRAR
jgi:hypothetical protein